MENLEEWKKISEFSYEASTLGRIRRCEVLSKYSNSYIGKILKPWTSGNSGYPAVTLIKDGKPFAFTVHRLITSTFLGPRPNSLVVHHIDGNANNNRLDNLGYTDYSHNTTASKDVKYPYKLSEAQCEKIKEYSKELTGKRIAEIFSCSQATISKVLNNYY